MGEVDNSHQTHDNGQPHCHENEESAQGKSVHKLIQDGRQRKMETHIVYPEGTEWGGGTTATAQPCP